jgi:hypothetical protein
VAIPLWQQCNLQEVEKITIKLLGKGLVLTADVPKGTLLLASKAYAVVFDEKSDDDDIPPVILNSVNLVTNEVCECSKLPLCIVETIQKLKREPETAKDLYGLYAGNEDRNMPTIEGVIDSGRIERICSFNAFAPCDSRNVNIFHH